jgi:hypothetical protein
MAIQGTAQLQHNLTTTYQLPSNMDAQVQLLVTNRNGSAASKYHIIMLGY